MASDDPNSVVALPGGTRSLHSQSASCPAGPGADRARQNRDTSREHYEAPKALAKRASFAVAMTRSCIGKDRARRERFSGGPGRRAFPMLEDAIEAENLPVVSVDQSRVDVTNTARGRHEKTISSKSLSASCAASFVLRCA